MGKDIGKFYKYGQSQLSTLSLKAPVSSSSASQKSSAIESITTSVPSVREKTKTILFCVPKIPSRMMLASQITTTYSLVREQESKIIAFQPLQTLIIMHNVLLTDLKVY